MSIFDLVDRRVAFLNQEELDKEGPFGISVTLQDYTSILTSLLEHTTCLSKEEAPPELHSQPSSDSFRRDSTLRSPEVSRDHSRPSLRRDSSRDSFRDPSSEVSRSSSPPLPPQLQKPTPRHGSPSPPSPPPAPSRGLQRVLVHTFCSSTAYLGECQRRLGFVRRAIKERGGGVLDSRAISREFQQWIRNGRTEYDGDSDGEDEEGEGHHGEGGDKWLSFCELDRAFSVMSGPDYAAVRFRHAVISRSKDGGQGGLEEALSKDAGQMQTFIRSLDADNDGRISIEDLRVSANPPTHTPVACDARPPPTHPNPTPTHPNITPPHPSPPSPTLTPALPTQPHPNPTPHPPYLILSHPTQPIPTPSLIPTPFNPTQSRFAPHNSTSSAPHPAFPPY